MKQFGSTITETIDAFRPHLGGRKTSNPRVETYNAIARIAITFFLLITGIWLIHGLDAGQNKMGMTIVGLIAGYWLR
jgi:hypothetical protein